MRAPLLLVHGLIGTLRDLVPFFRAIGIEAHAPSLLGYGGWRTYPHEDIGLYQQAAYLVRWMDEHKLERVHLVGHSVGGAVSLLFAEKYPDRAASLISVEGNFTLADAFWSGRVARINDTDVEAMMAGFRDDPAAWLASAGIAANPSRLAMAAGMLDNQPARTVRDMARSVVAVTGNPDYANALRAVFDGPVPVHLVAGTRSRDGWDVPDWARAACTSDRTLPGGHLMMVEAPEQFADAIAEVAYGDVRRRS